MLASTRENLDIIKLLVQSNADIYQVNKDGWNCLQIAVREGHEEIVSFFLCLDIKLAFEVKTKNGRTPSHTACLHGHLNILKILLENSDRLSDDSNKSIKMLNAKDTCGMTPLNEAILADHVAIVEYLIKYYSVNIYDTDNLKNTCIHFAAQSGSLKVLEYLYGKFFNIESIDNIDVFAQTLNIFNMTPMHSAAKNNKPEILEYFIQKLSSNIKDKRKLIDLINQKDSHQRSAMDICKSAKFRSCEMILSQFY